jgi:aryl-alcohol dehydrogenase-like predicted oxidoreductase
MEMRPLGKSGLKSAPLAFGGNVFGWTADEKTSFALLDAFVAAGFNLVDTADVYSRWAPGNKGGESETIIGKWLAQGGKRDKVLIATKCGMELAPDRKGLSAAYITRSVEDSLKRLQTDHIDLFQSHRDDPDTPLEETLGAYQRLIQQGKLRAIGASNYDARRLSEALAISKKQGLPRYETLQPHYNLAERALFEGELEDVCLKEGVGVIGYYSLASGFLTGKYRSEADTKGRARATGAGKYLNERGLGILKAVEQVAAAKGATPAQVSLAWLMARPSVTAPIASATSVKQLEELVKASEIKLGKDDIAALDKASA